jgi:hypothetical protein
MNILKKGSDVRALEIRLMLRKLKGELLEYHSFPWV